MGKSKGKRIMDWEKRTDNQRRRNKERDFKRNDNERQKKMKKREKESGTKR